MKNDLTAIARAVVADDALHARWLNSLSVMENTGARKIARYEDPVAVDLTVLKHAAEEFRHAFYLKKLIGRLESAHCPDYSDAYLLAPAATRHMLRRLDTAICRMLKGRHDVPAEKLKHGAYVLVTYAIETRADTLYGTYQEALTAADSRVNVKSIIAEEEGHLEEMTRMLEDFHPQWRDLAEEALKIEQRIFGEWLEEVGREVGTPAMAGQAL